MALKHARAGYKTIHLSVSPGRGWSVLSRTLILYSILAPTRAFAPVSFLLSLHRLHHLKKLNHHSRPTRRIHLPDTHNNAATAFHAPLPLNRSHNPHGLRQRAHRPRPAPGQLKPQPPRPRLQLEETRQRRGHPAELLLSDLPAVRSERPGPAVVLRQHGLRLTPRQQLRVVPRGRGAAGLQPESDLVLLLLLQPERCKGFWCTWLTSRKLVLGKLLGFSWDGHSVRLGLIHQFLLFSGNYRFGPSWRLYGVDGWRHDVSFKIVDLWEWF